MGKDTKDVVVGDTPLSEAIAAAGAGPGDRVSLITEGAEHDGAAMHRALDAGLVAAADAAEERFRVASRAMANARFEEAIGVLSALGDEVPARRGDCENNIGACLFFLGRYGEAIEHYRLAGELGFDARMVADNIAEAEEAAR